MIDFIFYRAVDGLVWLAGVTGLTYQEVNFWLFLVIWPTITLIEAYFLLLYVHLRCGRDRS